MRNTIFFILIFFISFCTNAQSVKYFDNGNNEISKENFAEQIGSGKYIAVTGETTHDKKLVCREETGVVSNYQHLKALLEKQTNQKLPKNSPIVIIFYPGKDPCNSAGGSVAWKNAWHTDLKKGIWKQTKTMPIYLCKDKANIDESSIELRWQNDPEHIVEKTFFKHHYPCGSFVVISPDGQYFSYFGEFTKTQVWDTVKRAIKQYKSHS